MSSQLSHWLNCYALQLPQVAKYSSLLGSLERDVGIALSIDLCAPLDRQSGDERPLIYSVGYQALGLMPCRNET